MKKVLVLVACATIFGSLAFAEKVMEVGLKGGLLLNAGTKIENDDDAKMSLGGDVGLFGHFGLADLGPGALSLQPELFLSFANGAKNKDAKTTYKANALDIAILIGYDIPVGKLSIRPFLGPKVGIPVGKAKVKYDGGSSEFKLKGVAIGMDFGCGVAVPLGKFVLGGDVRYGFDFTKIKNKDTDTDFIRRGALGINITAGYRF